MDTDNEPSLELMNFVLGRVREGAFLIGANADLRYVNEEACRALGYSRDELMSLHIADIDPEYPMERWPEHWRNLKARGSLTFESRHRRKDGSAFPVEITANYFEHGGQGFNLALARDITERKRAEAALRQKETHLRGVLEATADGILAVDDKGKTITTNRRFAELWKLPQSVIDTGDDETMLKFVLDQLLDPDAFLQKVKALYDTAEPGMDELRFKDGRVFERFSAPLLQNNALIGRVWSFRDVTERRRTEESLRLSEERFRLAMEGATDGLWDWDLRTNKVYYSPRWKSMLGYAEDELEDHLDAGKRVLHPDDVELAFGPVRELLEGRANTYEVEFRMRHKDGHFLNILSRAFVMRGDRGEPIRLVGTHVDITDRKEAEARIRQNEEFIRNILDTVDVGFIVVDRDYRIQSANRAYCRQVSLPCTEVIGKRCFEISHKVYRPCYEEGEECAVRQVFASGTSDTVVHRHVDPDGRILFVETKAYPIKDKAGQITSVIETISNITEKQLLEEERIKTQKLESIATLAGGIAHDFNNLLQGVFGYISMARMTFDQKEKSLAMLDQAEQALHQSVTLTTQLLTFSKGGKPVKKLIGLRPVIENSAKFALSGSRSDLRMNLPKDLWQTEADEGQLGQVIQNIVLNADQAMPVGGTVTVTAANMTANDAAPPPGLAKGDYIVISIHDTGVGIPKQYLGKIFDPYFTTKEKGSGLGLATSYSIVRNHGGMIDVKTKSGEGSMFTIYLPAREGAARGEDAIGPAHHALSRTGRILVMDDESIVRNFIRDVIGMLGHDVEVAKHGQEALEKYRDAIVSEKPFDIVILDLTVRGGMGGAETMRKLIEMDPAVKAIVSSGYSDDAAMANYEKMGFTAVLKKPYDIDDLSNVLNKILKGRG